MAIDIAQIQSLATVDLGCPPRSPIYEGDSFEVVFVIAEGFEADGTPIEPAPFFTDSGGWGLEIIMEAEDTLAPTVVQPTADDGQVIIQIALGESTGKVGKHRGNVRAYNPKVGRTQQRTLFNVAFLVTESPP